MKTILAVTHLKEDEQLERVAAVVKTKGFEFFTLCTNSERNFNFALQLVDSKYSTWIDGKLISPNIIWYATHPRTDALYCKNFRFTGEHRSTLSQLINDLHYLYRNETLWFPSNLDLIERAESKPFLLNIAAQCGLTTPNITINATLETKKQILDRKLYKKKLGFPSVITFDKKSGTEVITTTINKLGDSNAGSEVWQWQTPIESISHVRCCIIGTKIWSVIWERKSTIGKLYDYRSQQREEIWKAYTLPDEVRISLMDLMSKLELKIACPEFLITKDELHIFIDMNPCGDWAGFFEETTNTEIANNIANLLTDSYNQK